MSRKKTITVTVACVLAFAACIGGALAYLTDTDKAVNTFTIGEIRIDTLEPNYPGNGSDEVSDLVAMEEVKKDPQIKNTGKNRAIVFMQVDIPMSELITAQEDGTRNPLANVELFDFRTQKGEYDSVDAGWELIDTTYLDEDMNVLDEDSLTYKVVKLDPPATENTGSTVFTPVTDEEKAAPSQIAASTDNYEEIGAYCRRLYGYKTVVEEDETTHSLFDVVRSANIIEDFIDNSTQNIIITSYAIQAENVKNLTDATYDATMDKEQLSKLFKVYIKQSGDVISDDADTSNSQTLLHSTLNVTMSVDNTHLKLNTGDVADTMTKATVKVAYTGKKEAPAYTFTSSDTSVATIDENGTITGHAVGKSVITVTAINPDNDKAASASVTVSVRDVNSGESGN